MKTYRVELHQDPGSLAIAGERARSAVEELARDGVTVRWIRSVYVAEDDASFLVFEAPSPAAALEYQRIVEGGSA